MKQQQAILCADCGIRLASLGESLCIVCLRRDKKKSETQLKERECMESKTIEWLNQTTKKYTAFESFDDMVNAAGEYRPTLRSESVPDLKILADYYDKAKETKGDPRQAFRSS